MIPELLITRGIPASGKTTWGRAWVAEDETSRARVNRDDLRQNLFGRDAPLPYELEKVITVAQRAAVRDLLNAGISVVVDDTHLRVRYIREWSVLAQSAGASFRVVPFDTTLEECIKRDAAREERGERFVGEEVIRDMHRRFQSGGNIELALSEPEPYTYVPGEDIPDAWMVDIDGTLAIMDGRSPYDHSRVGEDKVNDPVAFLVRALQMGGWNIVLMSGRDEKSRSETEKWLQEKKIFYDDLFMRPDGDRRKDSVVKLELFQEHVVPKYRVMGVLDDRNQVVDMWRSIGLTCLQVAPGDF